MKKRVAQPSNINAYWRARDKRPDLFTFTEDGNLLATATKDLPEKTFILPTYRRATAEETELALALRDASFDPIYEKIEAAKKELRDALRAYKSGAGTEASVVSANQKVGNEEAALTLARSPLRWIDVEKNPTTNHILFSQPYEVRKLGYAINILKQRPTDLQSCVRELTAAELAALAEGTASTSGRTDSSAEVSPEDFYLIVADESVLGLHWPREVRIDDTTYFTAFQAILGETAILMGNTERHEAILGTRSAKTLRNLTKDLTTDSIPEVILQNVLDAIEDEIRETLVQTKDQDIVYANPLDPIFSVGLAPLDVNIQQPNKWRGVNRWGKALVAARTRFREQSVIDAQPVKAQPKTAAKKAVISEEEQKKAKVGSIIASRKGRG